LYHGKLVITSAFELKGANECSNFSSQSKSGYTAYQKAGRWQHGRI
jgi:hypothetical protein